MELGFPVSRYLPLFLLVFITNVGAQNNVFDVHKFGAVADGKTDNSKALSEAWDQACQSTESSVVMVPEGTYFVRAVVFEGPCRASSIDFDLRGTIKAPDDGTHSLNQESWLTFQNVKGLTLRGGGTFDGQGASAWSYNDCSACNKPLPASIRFKSVSDSNVNGIKSINSKKFMKVFKCNNMRFEQLMITAPGDSPNTDGIHISDSTNINIADSRIGTGDDCISMGPGTKFVRISNVVCGPGHGISIGSIGKDEDEDSVTGVVVQNCTISGTTNGLRIKTWAPSKPNLVNNITFEDILIDSCDNPIIIDQQYCPGDSCDEQSSKVQISDVRFRNIWGHSRTKTAVMLQCSKKVPCQSVELADINIVYGEGESPASSYCANTKGVFYGLQRPPVCSQGQNHDMQIGDSCPR